MDVKSPTYEPSDNHGMGMFFRAKSGNRYSATIRAEYGLHSTKLSAYYENPMSHGETLFVWLSPSMGSPTPMLVRLPNAWTPAYGNSATVHSGDIQSIVTARTGGPFVKSASATLNKSTHSYNVSCSLGASSYKFGSWVTYVGDNTGVIGDKNPGSNTIYDPLVYVSSWVDTNASGAYRSDMEGERELYIAGATYSNRSYGVATYDRYVHYQAKALSGRTVTKVIKLPAVKRFKIKYNGNGAVVDLYAVWDNAPMFIVEQYPDRYFTLEQVEAGDDVGVSIVGWDASEFTGMTDDGSVSIRYQVKDEAGNKAYLNIKVTVTKNGPLPAEEYSFYRAISDKYTGTLPAESRWLTDYTYQQALGDAFSGEAKTHSYTLNGGLLDEIRAYVETHGFGNSENPDALNGLFGSFGD